MSGVLVYAILALLSSMIFSGAEISFLSTHKLQLELQAREGSRIGKIMYYFAQHPAFFFCTALLGNIIGLALFVFFILQLPSLASYSAVNIFLLILGTTLMIIVITYLIPKGWAIISPGKVMAVVTIPFACFYLILFPLTWLVVWTLRSISQLLFKTAYPEHHPLFRLTQFHAAAVEAPGRAKEDPTMEQQMLTNAMEFKTVKIRECMVPRTEITAIDLTDGIEQLKQAFVDSGHSKILIFKKTIDDIIGYCHASSMFKKPTGIADIMIPIITAPETTPANELMIRFIQEKKSVAVVMDEFGGTAGIVSVEDIIEEIFGAARQDPGEDNLVEQRLDGYNFIFSARLEIEYLNSTYDLELPSGDYDTLAGLILAHTENIPAKGEIIRIRPFTFFIETSQNNRIDVVKITLDTPEGDILTGPNAAS